MFDEEIYTWLINNAILLEPAKKFLFLKRHLKEDVIQKLRIGSIFNPATVINNLIKIFGEEICLRTGLIRRGDYGLYFYFYTPCLLFPYYDQDKRLIGVQSRYLGTNEKAHRFQFMSSQETRLYNLPILNNLKRGDKLYISEGITDCLALLSDNLNAVAIPSATILPKEDLLLLKSYDLHMYPDQDEAGQNAFMALRRFFFVNQYSQQRSQIFALLQRKTEKKLIASIVGCSQPTLSREIRRNSTDSGNYLWDKAHAKAMERRKRATANRAKDPVSYGRPWNC